MQKIKIFKEIIGKGTEIVRLKKVRSVIAAILIALAAITGVCFFIFNHKEVYELQQNIYFMEWDNQEDKTIFYRYIAEDGEVMELGSMEGRFLHSAINKDETIITILRSNGDSHEIIRYDLAAGTFQTENIGEKIYDLTNHTVWVWRAALLYDGGNKILISYNGALGHEKWLFYDLVTEEYDVVKGREDKAGKFLAVNDHEVWYASVHGTLYRYDRETDESIEILDSFNSAAAAPDTALIAYIEEGRQDKKIYLYDINREKTKYIAAGRWNTYYGDIFNKEGQWSDDGRYFFYSKYFMGLFNAADISLMAYNTGSGRSFCIYKKKGTLHEFRYIGSSG